MDILRAFVLRTTSEQSAGHMESSDRRLPFLSCSLFTVGFYFFFPHLYFFLPSFLVCFRLDSSRSLHICDKTSAGTHCAFAELQLCIRGQSVWRLATSWTLGGGGSNPAGGEIFRTPPDRPRRPHYLLYSGYRSSFPGLKRPGRSVTHSPLSSAEVKERVELHYYSSSGPS
jgi:hypothetical protein